MPLHFLSTYFFLFLFTNPLLSRAQPLSYFYPSQSGQLIEHTRYSVDHCPVNKQAFWTIYMPTSSGGTLRTDNFKPDPLVADGSAQLSDYKGSGFDRGHLVPAGDMTITSEVMTESFYLSNMSPQDPGFNRGIWKKLESLTRTWAQTEYSTDVIVTGGILTSKCGTIGSGVTVPCYFYKIYASKERGIAIGFILPNEKISGDLKSYAVTIDEIERQTGIDFFEQFEDDFEEKFESTLILSDWNWSISKDPLSQEVEHESTRQCQGITTSGTRCKRSIKSGTYCWQHQM